MSYDRTSRSALMVDEVEGGLVVVSMANAKTDDAHLKFLEPGDLLIRGACV